MTKIKFLTAGESHGQGLLGIIEGIPAGLELNEEYINIHLKRRQKGFGRGGRMKIENDKSILYAGIRAGKTLGSPIGIIIKNRDWENWTDVMNIEHIEKDVKEITLPRPGHADLAGAMKYGFNDIRNVIERSSARETTMRVALGSVCRKLLESCHIHIGSYVTAIHNQKDNNHYKFNAIETNVIADQSPIRSLDKAVEKKMILAIKTAQKNKDTVGGKFQVIITGVPYGLGSYRSWNSKLNSKLSQAISSINAIKSVEIGMTSPSELYGSQLHDEIGWKKNKFIRYNNNAGGIEGGISNAQPIIINGTMKPLSTLSKPLRSIDIKTHEKQKAHKERTDSCAVPAAAIIAESMASIVITDMLLDKFGGDSMLQLQKHIKESAKY